MYWEHCVINCNTYILTVLTFKVVCMNRQSSISSLGAANIQEVHLKNHSFCFPYAFLQIRYTLRDYKEYIIRAMYLREESYFLLIICPTAKREKYVTRCRC